VIGDSFETAEPTQVMQGPHFAHAAKSILADNLDDFHLDSHMISLIHVHRRQFLRRETMTPGYLKRLQGFIEPNGSLVFLFSLSSGAFALFIRS
jgi:hypothetical protein